MVTVCPFVYRILFIYNTRHLARNVSLRPCNLREGKSWVMLLFSIISKSFYTFCLFTSVPYAVLKLSTSRVMVKYTHYFIPETRKITLKIRKLFRVLE